MEGTMYEFQHSNIKLEDLVCTHVDELVEVWYPLDGVADDEDDGDGQADLGQRQLLLPRRAADASVTGRRSGAWVTTLVLKYQIRHCAPLAGKR